jgi:peroxiredoxin
MNVRIGLGLVLGLAVFMTGCAAPPRGAASSPTTITPALVGSRMPSTVLFTPEARQVSLSTALARKPTVLVVYRGGWCLYCQKQLADLQKIEPDLLALGYQIIAISPDQPAELAKSIQNRGLKYQLLSDMQMNTAKALGLAYYVDAATRRELDRAGVNLSNVSAQPNWLLPVPAVFLVSPEGVVRWEYVNPDYRERVSPEVLLAAAKALAEKK